MFIGNIPLSDAVEERLASNYNTIIARIDECCRVLMNSNGSTAYTTKYDLFMKVFLAFGRLASVGNIAFFSKSSRRVNENLVNYLRLQMAWLHKSVHGLVVSDVE